MVEKRQVFTSLLVKCDEPVMLPQFWELKFVNRHLFKIKEVSLTDFFYMLGVTKNSVGVQVF